MASLIYTVVLCGGLAACAAPRLLAIDVGPETRSVEGWFNARVELSVLPVRNISNYNPFTEIDAHRCVTIVTEPPLDRLKVKDFDGKRVHVDGYVLVYDDLPIMPGALGEYLSKRTYQDEVVENYCYRNYIFVAKAIREAPSEPPNKSLQPSARP